MLFIFIYLRTYSAYSFFWKAEAAEISDEAKAKIRSLSQADIPIERRRALYNALNRRMSQGNLKPGLVEKYMAASSSRSARFTLLKEIMLDENMPRPQQLQWYGMNCLCSCCFQLFYHHQILRPKFHINQGAKCTSKLISCSRAPSKDVGMDSAPLL